MKKKKIEKWISTYGIYGWNIVGIVFIIALILGHLAIYLNYSDMMWCEKNCLAQWNEECEQRCVCEVWESDLPKSGVSCVCYKHKFAVNEGGVLVWYDKTVCAEHCGGCVSVRDKVCRMVEVCE